MARKTFVIDTNVLLHDPSAIQKFRDNDVVIPLVVLEELDALKRLSTELGKNAREVMRYVDSLKKKREGDFNCGILIPEGPKVRIAVEIKTEKPCPFPLPLDKNTNHILWITFCLKEKGENVVFVSKDLVSRVKAEAIGLEAEDYEGLKVSYSMLRKGLSTIILPKKEIDLFLQKGKIAIDGNSLQPNEYCILSAENTTALGRYNSQNQKVESLDPLPRDIWGVKPLNLEQRCVLDLLLRDDVPLVTLIGPAGTGKTLLALACGLHKVFDESQYSRILVSRPIVPLGKDIGYLPGTKEEKLFHWMQPIYDNLEFLCESSGGEGSGSSTLEWVLSSKKLELEAVTYIRGRTLPKIYMIIDEAQNLTPHEIKTIVSRAGKGAKVILTGDPTQIDNPYLDEDSNGMVFLNNRFKDQAVYGHVFLDKSERSELAAIAAEIM